VGAVSCDPPSISGAKWSDPSTSGFPLPKSFTIARDRGFANLAASFFKESMSRDAMIGMRIVHALRDAFWCQSQRSLRRQGEKKRTPRAGAECPPECPHTISTTRSVTADVWCATHRGNEYEQLKYQLTDEDDKEVHRGVSQNGVQDVRDARISIRP